MRLESPVGSDKAAVFPYAIPPMRACPETEQGPAAAPCEEAPRRPYVRSIFLFGLIAALVGSGGWTLLQARRAAAEAPPDPLAIPEVTVAVAKRAAAPVPYQTVGDIVREGEAMTAKLLVELPLPVGRNYYKVATAELRVRALDGRIFEATAVGAREASDRVVIEFDFPVGTALSLRSGKADVILTPPGVPVIVPMTAIVQREGKSCMALVNPNRTLRWIEVDVGRDLGSQSEVMYGLEEGAVYVQRADATLAEGRTLRVVKP